MPKINFSKVFGIKKKSVVVFTGAGGKTTLIETLAKELD